jgi:hypothetical protein
MLMWTYLEGLAAQLGVLEEVTQVRDRQDSVTYKTALAGAAIISHNVPVLEEEEKANLSSQPPPSLPQSSRGYRCPAFNCTRYFQRLDLFHLHIRDSYTNGHKILKIIIDQTCCLQCDELFTRSKDLVNHERSVHGAQYKSRVSKFIESQGQDDQCLRNSERRADHSPILSPNPEPPRDVASGFTEGQGRDDQCLGNGGKRADHSPISSPGSRDQDDQCPGNSGKRADQSPISSPNPEPPLDVASKDIPEATDYVPTTTKIVGNVCAPQHDSPPHSVSEANIEFAEPFNADAFPHSAFHVSQQPLEGSLCGTSLNSSLESNAQVPGGNFEFTQPPSAVPLSYPAFHVFQRLPGDSYVLQHGSPSNSNAQVREDNFQFTQSSRADPFSYPAFHVFQQPLGGDLYVLQHGSPPNSNAQVWGNNFQFTQPSRADPLSYPAFHVFQQPLGGDLYVLEHGSPPDSNAQVREDLLTQPSNLFQDRLTRSNTPWSL